MMGIGIKVRTDIHFDKLLDQIKKSSYRSLHHAAASLRKTALASIEKAPRGISSAPGRPPFSHGRLGYSIRYELDQEKQRAVVGPAFSVVGESMHYHEFGLKRGDTKLPKRPLIAPALKQIMPRLTEFWKNSVKS